MFYKTITAILVSLIIFSTSAFSDPGSLSITDFTMHKVTPVQDSPNVTPVEKKVQNVKKHRIVNRIKRVKPIAQPAPKVVEKQPEIVQKPETIQKNAADEVSKNQDIIDKLNKELNEPTVTKLYSETTEKNNYNDYIVRTVLSLGIVILLILILAWFNNKLGRINPNALFSGKFNDLDVNKFNVLSSSSLGQGKIIHLVEINGKQLVVGSTNNNINLLTEISPEDIDKLKENANNKSKSEVKEETQDIDGLEYTEPESYSAKYSNVYKDYLK